MPSFSVINGRMLPRLQTMASSILNKGSANRLGPKCGGRYFTSKTQRSPRNAGSMAPSSLFSKMSLGSKTSSFMGPRSAKLSTCSSSPTLGSWTTNGGSLKNLRRLRLRTSSSTLLLSRGFKVTPRSLHTEVDAELSRFLEKEIKLGQNTKKYPTSLPVIQGFEIVTDHAKVTLSKNLGNETITVNLNINHSVDADENEMLNDQKDEDVTQMVSRPPFSVEINQGEKEIFALQCSFPSAEFDEDPAAAKDEENMSEADLFQIDEVTIHEGDWSEKMYSLGAETMDGNLYDLLMDMLDERGINDEFINHLMDFCTVYEHKNYLTFLDGIKKFVDKK